MLFFLVLAALPAVVDLSPQDAVTVVNIANKVVLVAGSTDAALPISLETWSSLELT